jgi:hypothetical protein
MALKACTKCKKEYPATTEFFFREVKNKQGLAYFCKTCSSQRVREWEKKNPVRFSTFKKRALLNSKIDLLEYYSSNGRIVCSCFGCGVDTPEFLTLDHINGDGSLHRKTLNTKGGANFYAWLKKNNYPPGLQILCMNCNMAKHNKKECPIHGIDTHLILTFDKDKELGLRIGFN